MSLVFFGTPEFAVPPLEALYKSGERVSAVVTRPDKRRGRGASTSPSPVKQFALARGIEVLEPRSMKDEGFIRRLGEIAPEFIVVVAFGRILTQEIIEAPSIAPVNLHASLLPKYRGAAPISWAIINGERETGLCTMVIRYELDEGDLLICESTPIGDDDTAESLRRRLSEVGGPLLVRTLKGLREGKLKPRPQEGEPSFAPVLRKEDGRVDWSKPAVELDRFVRGMFPWPGAFCFIGGQRVRLIKTSPVEAEIARGTIGSVDKDSFLIGTGVGALRVIMLQPEGRQPMSARAYLQGRRLKEGDEVG